MHPGDPTFILNASLLSNSCELIFQEQILPSRRATRNVTSRPGEEHFRFAFLDFRFSSLMGNWSPRHRVQAFDIKANTSNGRLSSGSNRMSESDRCASFFFQSEDRCRCIKTCGARK